MCGLKKRITITVEEETFERFRRYCSENAMKVSSRIEKFIEDFLKEKDNSDRNKNNKIK